MASSNRFVPPLKGNFLPTTVLLLDWFTMWKKSNSFVLNSQSISNYLLAKPYKSKALSVKYTWLMVLWVFTIFTTVWKCRNRSLMWMYLRAHCCYSRSWKKVPVVVSWRVTVYKLGTYGASGYFCGNFNSQQCRKMESTEFLQRWDIFLVW